MSWTRVGLLFCPDGTQAWARTHAALPVPFSIAPDVLRFFFSARDEEQRSSVGWVDIDFSDAPRCLQHSHDPVLSPGQDGAFDDNGVSIGCLTQAGDELRLYYTGWNLGIRAPWRNALGLAQAAGPKDPFRRYALGPILDRSPEDPYNLSYPWVLPDQDGWRMWYGSNTAPMGKKSDIQHVIKTARSRDGIRWERDGATVIGFSAASEYAIARPTVVKVRNFLLMLFAHRGDQYRIGAAYSADGTSWNRIDSALGLDPAATGWDSEMTCYPALFWHRDKLWLAYNGNSYGKTGFGLAVWEGEPLECILAAKELA